MSAKIQTFLAVPGPLRPAYWETAVERNRLSLLIINLMIVGMESFNMLRVLLWSASGLGTSNNRVYFSLYAVLCGAAVVSMVLQWAAWRHRWTVGRRWAAQYGSAVLYLLWHVGLNSYDLYREPDGEVSIYMTAVLGLAVFIRMPAAYSVPAYAAAYAAFLGLSAGALGSGDLVNLTLTTIVALAVSLTGSHHAVVRLTQEAEIRQMNRQLCRLSRQDPLTGLLNRAAFEEAAAGCRARGGGAVTLLMLDLDNFKSVNDRFGHPCGDYVLRETAARLLAAFPAAEGVGRVGGDEFAVALAGGEDPADVERAGRRLIRELAQIDWQDQPVGARCSIGVSRSAGETTFEQLYQQADAALYAAKGQGKGCIRWSDGGAGAGEPPRPPAVPAER